jgi:23S rRNA pseudouridine2605 synthase
VGERLQKVLARVGYGSRRASEDLIREGRVRIGDRVAFLGDRVHPDRDRVSVDGAPVPTHPGLRYLAMNKPAGVTSTMADPHAQRTLAEYLPAGPRVVPVGRLDRESEGLLLFTNDGELAFRLQHPSYGVEKEYLVEVAGSVDRRTLARLRAGIDLEDGFARPVRVGPIHHASDRTAVTVVMGEGRKREVRRLFDALGHPVRRLVRTRIGRLELGRLAPGRIRALEPVEVAGLYRVVRLDAARPGARRPASSAGGKPRGASTKRGRRGVPPRRSRRTE